jgi:WD40 repeat protein
MTMPLIDNKNTIAPEAPQTPQQKEDCATSVNSYRTGEPHTPFRGSTPRMRRSLMSTPRRSKHRSRPTSASCDRFIPNRSRLDSSRGRSLLLDKSKVKVKEREDSPHREYRQRLRRVLFGEEDELTSVLGFNSGKTISLSSTLSTILSDPFDQDILRPITSSQKRRKRHRSINTRFTACLDAPGLTNDEDLNLVSTVGDYISLALDDTVYISCEEDITALPCPDLRSVTSLKWEPIKQDFLAVGGYGEVHLWDASANEKIGELNNHCENVTALDWISPVEIIAASKGKVELYDLRMRFPEYSSIPCERQEVITNLKYQQKTVAYAGKSVQLWDIRYSNFGPVHRLQHEQVRGMEFCPLQSDLLATGGKDGIKLWNTKTGIVKTTISISETNVNSVQWSPHRKELAAGHGNSLSMWSLIDGGEKTHPLATWGMPENFISDHRESTILSLEKFERGKLLSLHSSGWLVVWDAFGEAPVQTKSLLSERHYVPEFSVIR